MACSRSAPRQCSQDEVATWLSVKNVHKLHNIPAGLLVTDQRQQRLELSGGGQNDEVLGMRRVRGRTSSGKGRGVEHRGNLRRVGGGRMWE